jgi:two-component system, NarL family, invasion response regulator UvrY
MIKVLITDDHPVVRRGIRQILEEDEGIRLIDEASDGKELIEKMIKQEYDVILLDISLPGRSGLDLITQIKKIRQKTAVLILSIHSEEMYAIQALRNGASGYLTKMSAPEELITAIRKVSEGDRYITGSLAEKMTSDFLNGVKKPLKELLSARELEVLKLIADGKTVAQIASELSLSPKTISTYRSRLLEKLNLKTTADLIRYSLLEDFKREE